MSEAIDRKYKKAAQVINSAGGTPLKANSCFGKIISTDQPTKGFSLLI